MDLDERSITPLTDLADLEDKGHRIVDALAGDVAPADKTRRLLERLMEEKKDSFYGDVLFYLTSERYAEPQAQELWRHVLEHKYMMSERLARNVGIRVAAIDYLLNIRKLLITPRVINSADFRQTVKMARTDPLTGLYNRRHFMDQVNRILEAAARLKAPVSLIMADLDHFKPYNDTHGHQAGDLLLQEIARLVRGAVRSSDVVARYGGDEMALLLPKAAKEDALAVAEKVRSQIQENCQAVGVTISLGVAEYPRDAANRDDLIAAADQVLYTAKSLGGDRVCALQSAAFRYAPPAGETVQGVSIVGDFNNWSVRANPMARTGESGAWEATVSLKPGRYRYKLFINNARWIADPSARKSEDDGFGGRCSVLVIK